MDGIVTGLTSVIPIIPDNSIITDRNGNNGPPVEIMPLPQNSFMSEDATAELLNNPYKLALDIKGNGGRPQLGSGSDSAEEQVTGGNLGDAYKLTLGTKDTLQSEAEAALDISRMQSYEMLGKGAARQAYRLNHDTGSAEKTTAQPPGNASNSIISEKVRTLLAQSAALQNDALLQPEVQSESGGQEPVIRQDGALNTAALRLTASDFEVFATLEPELQETLLNMLRGENITPNDPIPTLNGFSGGESSETRGSGIAPNAGRVGSLVAQMQDHHLIIDSGLVRDGTAITNLLLQSPLPGHGQRTVTVEDTCPMLLTDEEQALSNVLTSGKTQSPAAMLEGSMENLRKITELPYALYVFGNVTAKRHGEPGKEDGLIPEKIKYSGGEPVEALHISQAVKMAAVLHNIYYGGSGYFAQETPWDAPYVRYALKNGIIKNGEFKDFNAFATRAETAYIFSNCVPRAELTTVNFAAQVPDVNEYAGYGDRIYLLLRAGVLSISNKKGFFYPESMITKTEAATIIGRIATPSDRMRHTS